jgi:hypothetical protein
LIKAALVLVGAAGLCLALSSASSADVVEPESAFQPASLGLLSKDAPAGDFSAGAPIEEGMVKAAMAAEPKLDEVVETPAPEEQVVRPAPVHLVRPNTFVETSRSVAEAIVHPLRIGFRHIGASLGRVVSACEIGLGTGTGGPVLVFAVLALAAPFIRNRVVGTRLSTDEDVPDLLYAWELTPPG